VVEQQRVLDGHARAELAAPSPGGRGLRAPRSSDLLYGCVEALAIPTPAGTSWRWRSALRKPVTEPGS
jgi:hypothetical protein